MTAAVQKQTKGTKKGKQMGMIIGGATVTVVEYKHRGMHVNCYDSRLQMVLQVIDNGALGDGLPETMGDSGWYGAPSHKAALDEIEKQVKATKKEIAKQERAERHRPQRKRKSRDE